MPTGRLDRAYRRTRYAAGPITVWIGEVSASGNAWMARHRVDSAVLLTAWNPRSRPMPDAWNGRAHARLSALLRRRPRAEGMSGTAAWQELTVAVPGGERFGLRLARRLRQRAFVLLRRGRPARLIYTASC